MYVTVYSLINYGGKRMAISYKKLWKILIDRDTKKGDLYFSDE